MDWVSARVLRPWHNVAGELQDKLRASLASNEKLETLFVTADRHSHNPFQNLQEPRHAYHKHELTVTLAVIVRGERGSPK